VLGCEAGGRRRQAPVPGHGSSPAVPCPGEEPGLWEGARAFDPADACRAVRLFPEAVPLLVPREPPAVAHVLGTAGEQRAGTRMPSIQGSASAWPDLDPL